MEGNNATQLSFPQFYTEFAECIKLQEWRKVNNRQLSAFLRDSPENFLGYLLQILSEDYPRKFKTQAIFALSNLFLSTERLEVLSIAFKKKTLASLFDLLLKLVYDPSLFAVFNQLGDLFARIYLKFPNEQLFLPAEILDNITKCKDLNEGPKRTVILFIISLILKDSTDLNQHANLIDTNEFIISDLDQINDPFVLASHCNICISLLKSPTFSEHHPQLQANLLKILGKILEIEPCKNCPSLLEEFFGYFSNFLSENGHLAAANNELVLKTLDFQKTAPLEIKKIIAIFLSFCTLENTFPLNDDILSRIFEVFLETLAESIPEVDEAWLQDLSFDKMSSEQNNICDYEPLAHFHFISITLYSNISDDIALHNLKKFSTTTNWKMICALLTALTNLVSFTDINTMSFVFPYVFSCLDYANPKVRLSILKLIDEMSIEFGEELYLRTHKRKEANILALLDDPVPRVRIMASFTIISYLNEIPKKESKKKLQFLIPKIKESINSKCYYFIPEVLSCASEFIHHLDEEAQEFAQELIPLVLGLRHEGLNPSEEANFYGKIMEFISIFIQAMASPNLVNPYKDQIVNLLLTNQGKITNAITLHDIYLLDAWQRMALIYRKDLQNYLAVVIGKMIPLGIKYMKDKEDLLEINDVFKGNFPRIYHTEVNRDQEIIKNLGEILKLFLESSEPETIKNYETLILFLTTSFKNIITGLKLKKLRMQNQSEEKEEENIYYEDFYYFYKDLIASAFLFLQHYVHKSSPEGFLSTFRRLNNALWETVECNPLHEKPLIKLLHSSLESIKNSLFEIPCESLSDHEVTQFVGKIKEIWARAMDIDFEAFAGEQDEEDDSNSEGDFVDLRLDIYFVIHEILSNLIKLLTEDQVQILVDAVYQQLYQPYFTELYPKEDLTETDEDILSSILFSLVEILQQIPAELIHKSLPWQKILDVLIKFSTYYDELIRHNSCFALGIFHEKVEFHHDLFPEITDYVSRTIEGLDQATEVKKNEAPKVQKVKQDSAAGEVIKEESESESGDGELNTDVWECLDNVYSSIGRMIKIYYGNNEFIKPDLIAKYLRYLPLKHDMEEGKDQHELLMGLMLKKGHELLALSEGNYGEFMRIMGELCLPGNEDILELRSKKKLKKVCVQLKTEDPAKFEQALEKLTPEQRTCLLESLSNKELDED